MPSDGAATNAGLASKLDWDKVRTEAIMRRRPRKQRSVKKQKAACTHGSGQHDHCPYCGKPLANPS
jgi:hypothetical protein